MDALMVINGGIMRLETGNKIEIPKWDLIIAHPPCTYISAASAVRLFNTDHTIKDVSRFQKLKESVTFFKKFLDADCDRIAIENPTPLKIAGLPKYTQIIEPFFFGDPWQKRTCLWLKNLPVLEATNMVKPVGYWVGAHGHNKAKNGMSKGFRNPKLRSKTFPGIARAMAEQWG